MIRFGKTFVSVLALALGAPAWAQSNSLQVYTALRRGGHAAPAHGVHQAERAAAQTWAHTGSAAPLAGPDGMLLYAYGASRPEVLCAPLHLCVVTLLPGEKIVDLSIGDSVRWLVQPAQAGNRPVIVIKPTTAGIRTNLVITTDDGHLYYLDLVAARARFIPEIGFYDPRALVQSLARAGQQARSRAQTVVATLPGIDPGKLDFRYWWEGPKADRPVRVFSARGKVYIEMPKRLRYGDAPAVFVVVDGKQQLVNYRMVGSYYVVDELFKEARLVLGVGDHRQVVTLHAGRRPFFW